MTTKDEHTSEKGVQHKMTEHKTNRIKGLKGAETENQIKSQPKTSTITNYDHTKRGLGKKKPATIVQSFWKLKK